LLELLQIYFSYTTPGGTVEETRLLDRQHFDQLFHSLQANGYEVVGPTLQDGAIAYVPLDSPDALPSGWTDEQDGGVYRIRKREDAALFGYSVAPQSWKKFLFLPTLRLWEARYDDELFRVSSPEVDIRKRAFLGVRSCEIKAIEIQDRILIDGPYPDTMYSELRRNALIVAVQSCKSGGTCFCVSMDAGPRVTRSFDILLTELTDSGRHRFLVQTGSENGARILQNLPLQPASNADIESADRLMRETATRMGRVLDQTGIKELLYRNYEHPRWLEVSRRCLTCTNCTLVCPTCFCMNVEDVTDLSGGKAERWRRWDSCFTLEHSSIHGGCVRCSGISRYRQWMTHKLATWIDQFGTSGCVGCGRCITWCPVGIDITEEARAMQDSGSASSIPFGKKGE
jgi:sulfhydrogenase subunit beta (sulfur reductase)